MFLDFLGFSVTFVVGVLVDGAAVSAGGSWPVVARLAGADRFAVAAVGFAVVEGVVDVVGELLPVRRVCDVVLGGGRRGRLVPLILLRWAAGDLRLNGHIRRWCVAGFWRAGVCVWAKA